MGKRDVAHGVTPSSSASTRSRRVRDRTVEIEALVETRGRQVRGDLGIVGEHVAERPPLLPRPRRRLLDQAVRVVALEARLDQREEHGLAEHEAVRRVEVLAHPVGVHDEPFDDAGNRPVM